MEEKQTLRIVMLGKTGIGKSSLANTIYGEKGKFKESARPNSETKKCRAGTTKINGRNIRLIDTPGLFDTDLRSTELCPEILKCIKECAPGPHAFLIVLRVERFTSQEEEVVDKILKYFSEEALNYTTVVFTHGDDLTEGENIKDWASKNKALKTLVQKCGGRVHVFDNKRWDNSQDPYRNNQYQVRELLNSIEETEREKDGKCYTNKFLEFLINRIKKMCSVMTYPVMVLLGALLGAEEFAKDLFERNDSARPRTDEDTSQEQEMDKLRIVLLGKCGSGKSNLANTIFGDRSCFKVYHGLHGTSLCQSITRRVNGRNVQLIDTPGLFSDLSSEGLKSELRKSIVECAPGPHAFLLVLKVEKFTQLEQAMVDEILECFSEEALKYTTVVFTHGDLLPEEMRVNEWVHNNSALESLVQKCGGRCHVFDNKYWNWNNSQDQYRNNQYQVDQLLQTIDRTVRENEEGYYTNEMLQRAQEQIEERKAHIRRLQRAGSSHSQRPLFSEIRDWFSNKFHL